MRIASPTITPASRDAIQPAHEITYRAMPTEDGDVETGGVLLDGRPIGRLSLRPSAVDVDGHPSRSLPMADGLWHAFAVGWRPHEGRPWDTRITSSAPTRRRAAEDLLRAYRYHR